MITRTGIINKCNKNISFILFYTFIVCFFTIFYNEIAYASFKITRNPIVKIRISKAKSSVVLSGKDIMRTNLLNNKRKRYIGKKGIKYNCYTIQKWKRWENKRYRPIFLASLKSRSSRGLISFENEHYLGKIIIATSNDRKSCDVINELSMEEYISTLLSREMNSVWPIEALKAQAVAARTYALYKMRANNFSKKRGNGTLYDLESSERHQVAGSFFDITERTKRASEETAGKVLVNKKGALVPAFFHAKCGGKTFLPHQIWDNSILGYKSIRCPHCHGHGKKSWVKKVLKNRLYKFLKWAQKKGYIDSGKKISKRSRILIAPDRLQNLKLRFYVDDDVYVIKKTFLRRFFGRNLFPSNYFLVKNKKRYLKILGAGNGHGVGMCQLGALHLAKIGFSYKKILSYYFPQLTLTNIY